MKVEYEKVVTLADVKRIESVSLEDRNLPTSTYQVLKESAADYADATAISFLLLGEVDEAPTNYTYADLFARVTQAANLFHSQGVGKTDVVSLILPNLPQTHFALWGGEAAGIAGPVNPMLEAPVIAEMLREVEAKVIVTIAPTPGVDIWEKVAEAAKDIPSLKAIYTIDPFRFLPGVEEARPQPEGMPVPVLDFDDACAAHPSDRLVSERQFEPTDVAAYFHTGGTTGSPKVAQHTHGMQVLSSWVTVGVGEFEQGTTVLGALPLFHVTGMMVTGLGVFAGGSTLAMMTPQGFRNQGVVKHFWKHVERFKINFAVTVPTILAALLEVPVGDADISSLKFVPCGAAPLAPDLQKRFEETAGVKVLEGYGMTEGTAANTGIPRYGEQKSGSIGIRLPYIDVKTAVLDEDGKFVRDCKVDEIGTILISGPMVFPGYVQEDRNKEIWAAPGWYNTGDLARQDADGYFFLTGRQKDLIIRGGHNIDPSVIETTLSAHEAVALVAAIGQPDAYAGELPCAYVQLREGVSVTADELRAFAKDNIGERAAVPVRIEIVEAMPVTTVGKIFKPDLRLLATTFALSTALKEKGLDAQVNVERHEKHGTLAKVALPSDKHAEATSVLGPFPVTVELVAA